MENKGLVDESISQLDVGTTREDAQTSFDGLKKLIQEVESLLHQPDVYITDEISELKRRVEDKRDELKIVIDREAQKLTTWLDEFQSKLIQDAQSEQDDLKDSSFLDEASVKVDTWTEKIKKIDENKSEFKEITKNADELNTKLTGLALNLKEGLLSNQYWEKREAVNLFSKVNINPNLSFWKIHSQIINMSLQSDFLKACGFQTAQKWDLLYRADGNEYSSHELLSHCAGRSPTLVIIKLHNGIITGGYTEFKWDKVGQTQNDPKGFVFRKSGNDGNFEIYHKNSYDVVFDPSQGPSFYGPFGFQISNNSVVFLFKNSISDHTDRFMLSSIEVFRRVKKRVDFFERNGAGEKDSKTAYKTIRYKLKNWG